MSLLRVILCVILPPLAVIDKGCGAFLITTLLTLAGWIPRRARASSSAPAASSRKWARPAPAPRGGRRAAARRRRSGCQR